MVDAPTQEANYETLGTDDASQNLENGQSQPKTEQKSKDENPSRETWTNQFQFGIHSLAFMVGGGNLWRFPFLVHKYGGGTFVTVYWIMFFLASVPLVFLEFFLGQFHSQGPINIFRHMAPAFEGIGWAIMLVNLSSTITYNALLAWSLYYFASSFDPPWSKCRYGLTQWNSEHCYSIPAMQQCLGDGKEQKWFVKGRCYDELNISKLLHHIDDCYDNVWLRRDRMEGREARKHFSNCSFAFQLKFHPQRKAAAFLFGKNATWDTNRVSSCIGKKAGQCVFLKSDLRNCEKAEQDLRPISEIKGSRTLDMRFRDPQVGLSSSEVETRGNTLQEIFKSSYHRKISDMLKQYCKKNNLVQCLKKCILADESWSSSEFYHFSIDSYDGSVADLQGLFWPVSVSLAFAWALIAGAAIGKKRYIGKIVYVTALFPCLSILGLVFFTITLEGSQDGIAFYLATRPCEMGNLKMWLAAFGQVCYSLGIGGGALHTLASYNRFRHDVLRDALIVSVANCVFSLVSGFVIFGLVGYLAHLMAIPIEDVMSSSSMGLAFEMVAHVTTGFKGGLIVGIIFFFTVICLVFDSELILFETLKCSLLDKFPGMVHWRISVISVMAAIFFMLGLPSVTRAGIQILTVIDTATFEWLGCFCVLMEVIFVVWVYGIKRLIEDISMMTGTSIKDWDLPHFHVGHGLWKSRFKYYFIASWTFTVPLGVVAILVLNIISHFVDENEKSDYLGSALFVLIGHVAFPVILLGGFIWHIYIKKISFQEAIRPTKEWGPALEMYRQGRYFNADTKEPVPSNLAAGYLPESDTTIELVQGTTSPDSADSTVPNSLPG